MKIDNKLKIGGASVVALAAGSTAVSAQDWTGFYAGLSVSGNSGTSSIQPYVYDEGYTAGSDVIAGAFGGLRWDVGNTGAIMGVELAYQGASDLVDPVGYTSNSDYQLNEIIDLKLSVGSAVGNALIYGFAGISSTSVSAYDSYIGSAGANYGIGIDYMVTDSISVGAEFISRHMSGYTSNGNPDNSEPLSSISLRASFNF